jgi:hypothetical protein
MLYAVVYICAEYINPNECNTKTARAYQAYAEPVVVCGLPSQYKIAQSPIAPDEHEYLKIKCVRKDH